MENATYIYLFIAYVVSVIVGFGIAEAKGLQAGFLVGATIFILGPLGCLSYCCCLQITMP